MSSDEKGRKQFEKFKSQVCILRRRWTSVCNYDPIVWRRCFNHILPRLGSFENHPLFLQSSTGEQAQQGTITNARGFLVSTAGTLGSLAVSLALTGVYLSQNNIMQDQVETQTKQLRSMRQEKLPLLGVHEGGVELHDTKPVVENTDDSSLEVSDGEEGCWASVAVENHGDEIAQQVHMACLIDFPEIADKPPLVSGFCAMESTKTVTDSPVGNGALVSSETGLVLLRGMPRLRENTPPWVRENNIPR